MQTARAITSLLIAMLLVPVTTGAQELVPTRWEVGTALGSRFPSVVIEGTESQGGRAVALSVRAGWRLFPWVYAEGESVFVAASGWHWNPTGAATAPCPIDEPCIRREGIGSPLLATGAKLVLEPRERDGLSAFRLSAGLGRLLGDAVNYGTAAVGVRFGPRTGTTLVIEYERWFFDTPQILTDVRRPQDGVISTELHFVRPGFLRVSVGRTIGS